MRPRWRCPGRRARAPHPLGPQRSGGRGWPAILLRDAKAPLERRRKIAGRPRCGDARGFSPLPSGRIKPSSRPHGGRTGTVRGAHPLLSAASTAAEGSGHLRTLTLNDRMPCRRVANAAELGQRRLLRFPAREVEPQWMDDRQGERAGVLIDYAYRPQCGTASLPACRSVDGIASSAVVPPRRRLSARTIGVSGNSRALEPVRSGRFVRDQAGQGKGHGAYGPPPLRKSNSGMPSFLALSARLSLIPEPGNTTTPIGNTASN